MACSCSQQSLMSLCISVVSVITSFSFLLLLIWDCSLWRPGFDLWVEKIPWRRERLPTPVFWPGEFHGPYSPWGHKESDITEQLSTHTHICVIYLLAAFDSEMLSKVSEWISQFKKLWVKLETCSWTQKLPNCETSKPSKTLVLI